MIYPSVGTIPMPAGFPYAEVFRRGRPRHGSPGKLSSYDDFYRRHPPMETTHRAKIFASFDALRGFSEAVAAKEVLYEPKRELTEEETAELDRRFQILRRLTENSRSARENRVRVTVTHYVPCRDPESEAYSKRGTSEETTGILLRTDPLRRLIFLDTGCIKMDNITGISSDVISDSADRGGNGELFCGRIICRR